MTKSEVGILSEWRVARDRSDRGREELIAHRYKTPFAEIDLLTRAPNGALTLIEVKSVQPEFLTRALVKQRQRARLYRAREHLEERAGREVRLLLACVNPLSWEERPRYFEL